MQLKEEAANAPELEDELVVEAEISKEVVTDTKSKEK